MKKKFSVVIPIYKNEKNLPYTMEYIYEKMPLFSDYDVEIIMVNDGSPDNSYEVMKDIQKKNPKLVKIISLSRNFGQMEAMHAGMDYASGDVIGVISADMQEPIELFADMLKAWEEGYLIVNGVRAKREEKGLYSLCASVFHKFVSKHLNGRYPRGGSDFFLMDRKVMEEYLKIDIRYSAGMMTRFWLGHKTKEIEYVRKKREIGKSGFSISGKMEAAFGVLFMNSTFFLRLMFKTALLFIMLGFAGAITCLCLKNMTALIISVMFFLTGFLLCGHCILGEYIWRTYEISKHRPRYLVEEKIFEECGEEEKKV